MENIGSGSAEMFAYEKASSKIGAFMSDTIFLSYAHQDRDQVGRALEELTRKGVLSGEKGLMIDPKQNIKSGSYIKRAISDHIKSTGKVVLLWTEAGAKSQWVNWELGMADALGKPIILVIMDKSAPKLPENLTNVQVVKL
jgi:hypothetical protein